MPWAWSCCLFSWTSADLGKYLLCAPSVLMHILLSFPMTLIQLCTWCCFPMALIWVCIRKQEEKEELLKSSSAYPVALTETGWKISERKFFCWQNARLIKSKWASQHKCEEFLRFPVRSVGWRWGEPWLEPQLHEITGCWSPLFLSGYVTGNQRADVIHTGPSLWFGWWGLGTLQLQTLCFCKYLNHPKQHPTPKWVTRERYSKNAFRILPGGKEELKGRILGCLYQLNLACL